MSFPGEPPSSSRFGMDTLFESATSFLRRATDTTAPLQPPRSVPATTPAANSLEGDAIDPGSHTEDFEATAKEALANINDIIERLAHDAWMHEKPRYGKLPRISAGQQTKPEDRVVGAEIQTWLARNPDQSSAFEIADLSNI